MDEIELELLYNQNDICEAFLYQGEAEAVRLFERKIESLARLPEGEELMIRRIFLTSLNRSLYNYILFSHGISLCECCYENFRQLAQAGTAEEFARAGREIQLMPKEYAILEHLMRNQGTVLSREQL